MKELLNHYQVNTEQFQIFLRQWLQDKIQFPNNPNLMYGQHGQEKIQLNLLTQINKNKTLRNVLIQLKEQGQMPSVEEIIHACSNLTPREAEVMHWVIMGKTNRDIAEILSLSPRTVNKHLEHVFEKLYVETRTAAVLHVVSSCQNVTTA